MMRACATVFARFFLAKSIRYLAGAPKGAGRAGGARARRWRADRLMRYKRPVASP